ncbi:MAG TPA: carboxy terminal-processing peptidase [Burkholderiales bacterium]|nr:carboxy terminal-processing peptidase [Burkholderiales bacterium]
MKRYLLWVLLLLASIAQGAAFDPLAPPPELKPAQQEAKAAHMAAELLARYHYRMPPVDEALSQKIFDKYLKSLDPEKLFFVQPDIDRFAGERGRLGLGLLREDLSVPFAMFNLYEQRAAERFAYARSLLKTGFDFKQDESYQLSRENAAWAKTEAEINDLWRKRVKNDWLRLKLAGKDDKGIVDVLDKRYDGMRKRLGQMKSADAFQVYMNAYTTAIEPHTSYMGPREAEDFDIQMRLSLVGIGAVLTESDDFPTVRELVPGGPAALSGLLMVGDHIAGVAQGEGSAMTDVQGWRLDDAVQLIRGAPDSVVVLDILPAGAGPDGKHRLVTLVRKKISLEQQAAKSSVRSMTDGKVSRRIGVITLPTFYEDFAARQKGDPNYKSATRDVARLLDELKKEKVDAVLIDLRNNGGGSLTEAIELTGLFIGKGPVVQQRDASGEITVERDTDPGVAWSGPLGVLINRGSASASEIFAAAMQDYGRGLIIGEPSFGKGTVQTVIDLDRIARNGKPQFGELKLTVAQFFRINGGTTQLRGVTPDISFPPTSGAEDFGESSFDNALPWMQIKAADYKPEGDLKDLLPILSTLHDARVKKDRHFQYLQEDIAQSRLERDRNLVSLNEAERRKEREAQEARLRSREERQEGKEDAPARSNARPDDGLQAGERNFANELAAEKTRKSAEDFLLNEAVNILGDELEALKTGGALAARVRPDAARVPE